MSGIDSPESSQPDLMSEVNIQGPCTGQNYKSEVCVQVRGLFTSQKSVYKSEVCVQVRSLDGVQVRGLCTGKMSVYNLEVHVEVRGLCTS